MTASKDPSAVPVAVGRFVKQLVITHKALRLYPAASSIPKENAKEAVRLLDTALREKPEMRLTVNKDGFYFEEVPLFHGHAPVVAFAQELYSRKIFEVRFHAGVVPSGLVVFLGVLGAPADELSASGGATALLWDGGVDTITVVEASTTVFDQADLPEDEGAVGEAELPDQLSIDELLTSAKGASARGRRQLIRMASDSDRVASHLAAAFDRFGGSASEAACLIDLASLLRVADGEPDESRTLVLNSLAVGVCSLEPDRQRALLLNKILPMARTQESMAALVEQIGVDDVCQLLVGGIRADEVPVDELTRALRNFILISTVRRDEVLDSIEAAMRSAGFGLSLIESVLEAVAPTHLRVKDGALECVFEGPEESLLRLVEIPPTATSGSLIDTELAGLREEVQAGITDGDIMAAFAMLAVIDLDQSGFECTIRNLEIGLGLLVARGEFEVAADTAELLVVSAKGATDERGERLLAVVSKLAEADEMRAVHGALQIHAVGTPEREACMRLLLTLGTLVIDPLLEILADEQEMSVRKSLVGVISTIADHHIDDVGERVSDPRWYVARNVVSILGATKRPDTFPYLERTLRHSDARVRRETIRAVAGISDALTARMLSAALEDCDAQNVQLAARYLGRMKAAETIPALARVARGEGRGSREQGPRIEAIEALGVIGAPEALPTLNELAGRRRLMGGGRGHGIVAAASSAIAMIETSKERGDR